MKQMSKMNPYAKEFGAQKTIEQQRDAFTVACKPGTKDFE